MGAGVLEDPEAGVGKGASARIISTSIFGVCPSKSFYSSLPAPSVLGLCTLDTSGRCRNELKISHPIMRNSSTSAQIRNLNREGKGRLALLSPHGDRLLYDESHVNSHPGYDQPKLKCLRTAEDELVLGRHDEATD